MTTGTAIVINPAGLHARPAATFAAAAAKFKATVKVKNLDSSSEAVSANSNHQHLNRKYPQPA